MKNRIIYIASFLITFAVITLLIIELNKMYTNIFQFNFTEVQDENENIQYAEIGMSGEVMLLKKYLEHEFRDRIVDSVKANTPVKIDTVYKDVVKDEALLDSLEQLERRLEKAQNLLARQTAQSDEEKPTEVVDKDWIRKTSKLLEEMEPKKAAKVIKNYSDNEARELIYAMKQKKAAEILSILDPVFVNKITSSQI